MTWNRWSLAIVAAMFVLAGVCYPFMADSLPIHWTDGVADSYAGKTRALFFLPIMTAVLYSVAWLITRHHEEGAIGRMVFGLAVFGLLVQIATLVAQMGTGIQVHAVVVGIVLIVLPFLTPREQNYLIGVRTTWTLRSRRSWEKSNRLMKYLFVPFGGTLVAMSMAGVVVRPPIAILSMLAVGLVLVVYSYVQWRLDPGRG